MPVSIEDSPTTTKRRRRLVYGSVLLLMIALAVVGFRRAGYWLVREDPLAPAGVIVVLSGAMPYRAEEAARLLRLGYAPEVWVSRPVSPAEELHKLGIDFVTEEEYNREVLVHEGVPAQAVHIFPDTIVDTEQEVEETARDMRQTGKSRVIIVTSPQHTRRVKTLWAKLAPRECRAIVRAAYQDPFDARHWWRNTRDALAVTREYLALINAWAGLPVRPHSELAGAAPMTSK